jgi:hypothetical protein
MWNVFFFRNCRRMPALAMPVNKKHRAHRRIFPRPAFSSQYPYYPFIELHYDLRLKVYT